MNVGGGVNTLSGKRVLVTGGASGIGGAISSELAAQGATVIVHYFRSKDAVKELQDEVRASGVGEIIPLQADLTQESTVAKFAEDVVQHGPHALKVHSSFHCFLIPMLPLGGTERCTKLGPTWAETAPDSPQVGRLWAL